MKKPYINPFEDPLLRQNAVKRARNTPPPEPKNRSVQTTSNNTGGATSKSGPVKSSKPGLNQSVVINASNGVSSGKTAVVSGPEGTIILETDKNIIVNTYEEIVEQRYFNTTGGAGSLDIGTVSGSTFTGSVSAASKLGFDTASGFTVTDIGGGLAKVEVNPNATLASSVEVIGTSLGAVDEGYVFPAGTTFTDFVMTISQKTIPPTYTPPALTLNGTPSPANTEIGTIINPIFNRVFTQNDAGASSANRLYKNSVQISTSFPYTDTGLQLTASTAVFQAQVDYAQGPVKNNNMGNPDPTGQIPAGTISSNTLTYVGIRKSFYGTPLTTPTTSNDVRAMSGSSYNTANNPDVNASGENLVANPVPNYTITIPVGATRVTFAYPDTSRSVASVRYQELAFSEVKGNFTQTTVSVAGANSYLPVSYRVYTYVPVEPFSQEVHYLVYI